MPQAVHGLDRPPQAREEEEALALGSGDQLTLVASAVRFGTGRGLSMGIRLKAGHGVLAAVTLVRLQYPQLCRYSSGGLERRLGVSEALCSNHSSGSWKK